MDGTLKPDSRTHLAHAGRTRDEFARFVSIGSEGRQGRRQEPDVEIDLSRSTALGVTTNRDEVVYDFDREPLVAASAAVHR